MTLKKSSAGQILSTPSDSDLGMVLLLTPLQQWWDITNNFHTCDDDTDKRC